LPEIPGNAGEKPLKDAVFQDVDGCVGRRQCLGDDEVGGREPEERQNEDLASPAADKSFENGDFLATYA
jgi:hypothetical protein